ncbi:hypothetical protein HZA38_04345 [Candidatus Peregrinibacteria bacterium]|nr:hypothetical protein [Candidatus Peregrinibacteria bacterium]
MQSMRFEKWGDYVAEPLPTRSQDQGQNALRGEVTSDDEKRNEEPSPVPVAQGIQGEALVISTDATQNVGSILSSPSIENEGISPTKVSDDPAEIAWRNKHSSGQRRDRSML